MQSIDSPPEELLDMDLKDLDEDSSNENPNESMVDSDDESDVAFDTVKPLKVKSLKKTKIQTNNKQDRVTTPHTQFSLAPTPTISFTQLLFTTCSLKQLPRTAPYYNGSNQQMPLKEFHLKNLFHSAPTHDSLSHSYHSKFSI